MYTNLTCDAMEQLEEGKRGEEEKRGRYKEEVEKEWELDGLKERRRENLWKNLNFIHIRVAWIISHKQGKCSCTNCTFNI